jgi:hypothetical protein
MSACGESKWTSQAGEVRLKGFTLSYAVIDGYVRRCGRPTRQTQSYTRSAFAIGTLSIGTNQRSSSLCHIWPKVAVARRAQASRCAIVLYLQYNGWALNAMTECGGVVWPVDAVDGRTAGEGEVSKSRCGMATRWELGYRFDWDRRTDTGTIVSRV